MIVRIPEIRSTCEGFGHIAALDEQTAELRLDQIDADFSDCTFFEANMAAPLAMVLSRAADGLNDVRIVGIDPRVQAILCKNRFLVGYGYEAVPDTHQTTLPFRRMMITDHLRFADYLVEHLQGKGIPPMSPSLDRRFRQSIHEIFENAVQHSEAQLGIFVCGQFYPQRHRLDITISDSGIGIRTNVRRHLGKNVSSVDAIRWALTGSNTTKTGRQPGGVGLKLLREFAALNRGKLQIASRFGFYECTQRGERYSKLTADLPGTSVNIEVNTNDDQSYALQSEMSMEDIF